MRKSKRFAAVLFGLAICAVVGMVISNLFNVIKPARQTSAAGESTTAQAPKPVDFTANRPSHSGAPTAVDAEQTHSATAGTNSSREAATPWQQALANSTRPNDYVLRTVLAISDFDTKKELLLQAYSQAPDSVLVNHELMLLCIGRPNTDVCSLPIAETLLEIDGDNLYTQVLLAQYAENTGDSESALLHLREAVDDSNVEDYATRFLAAMDESYLENGFEPDANVMIDYVLVSGGASVGDVMALTQLCKKKVDTGAEDWRPLCAQVANKIAAGSKSMLNARNAERMAVQYSGLPDDLLAARMNSLEESYEIEIGVLIGFAEGSQNYGKKEVPTAIWRKYMALFKSEGEIAAQLFILEYFNQNAQ